MGVRIQSVACVAVGLAVLLLAASAAAHSWDQQKVSDIATQLERGIDALLADPQLDVRQATAMQQREHEAAISTVRQVQQLVEPLRRRLASGYTRDETEAFWSQIAELRGDIQAYARHSWLPEPTRERAARVGELLDALGHYYETES